MSRGHIDRILIKDFKSYGGDHIIGPFKTFTSIIGPNGAGKSNLMDAISFVFGVRSAQLRGSQLRDLVHRKETETATQIKDRTAFVELVFVKSDRSELCFRRTITTTGSADYTVNKRTVTAAGYNAELEKLGVLVASRNFLVFQGDVESVARKTPKEITALIEELSGSGRLREEYEKKKEVHVAAEEEMIRSFERKKNINKERKQLREQKDEADKFESLNQELKDYRVEFMLWQLYNVEKDRLHEIASLDTEKQQLEVKREEANKVEAVEDELQRQKATHHKERIVLEKKLVAKQKEMEKKGTVVAKLQEQLSHTQKQQSETEKKRAATEKEYTTQQEQQKSLQAEIEDVNKTLARLEVAEADEGGELHLEVAQIAEYQKLKNQANTATNALTREADGLRREHETLKERHSHLDNSVQTLTDRLKESQLCAQRLSQRKDEMERTIVESDKDLASLRTKFDAENEAIRSTSDKKAELENSIDALNAALADSKASRRDNEREQKLSDAVEQMKRLYPGVLGRLVDLCRPTQHKYGMAVQVGLGKNMEAIIVDTDQTARDGIAYLKEQRVGVATFIPHQSVRAEPVKDSMRELGGTIKPLLDVINFDQDEAVQRALLYAIGNTLVCDTLDEARRLAYGDKNKRYKIVVLDGTLLSRNGNITGGGQVGDDSHRSSSWDERDYQRNKAERDRLVKERSELDRGHRNDQLHAMRLQMSNLENRMANMKIDVQMSAEKLAKEVKEQAGIQAELTTKVQLESTARAQFAEVAGKLEALEARIRKEHEKIFRDFSKKVGVQHVHEYEQSRLSAIQKRTQQRVNLTDQKSKLENQLQYEASRDVAKQLESIQQKLVELQKSVDAQQKELEKTKKQDGKQECDAMAAQVKERQDEEDKVDAQIKRSRASNQQIFKDVHAIEKNLISREAIIDKLNTVRREFLRRSEMESIQLPVTKKKIKSKAATDIRGRAKKARTVAQRRRGRGEEENSESEEEGDAMDVDNEAADAGEESYDYDIDFSSLTRNTDIRTKTDYDRIKSEYMEAIESTQKQIDDLNPNLKASEKFHEAENKLQDQEKTFSEAQSKNKQTSEELARIQAERRELFLTAFERVSAEISVIYRMLTSDGTRDGGGMADLVLDNDEEPYLGGITYSVMPPGKRFRGMEQMSGGEKTVASLALLFALHSFHPAPFFVLDEVDAALDAKNVFRVSNYIRRRAHEDKLQCLVISLKDSFYEKADGLVGVYKDKATQCSGTLTLDLTQYAASEAAHTS